jgi:hypothetical protein
MSVFDLIGKFNVEITNFVSKEMTKVNAEDIGIDARCGSLFIDHDTIAVRKCNDGTLQYYGGFEYVDKEYRREVGDWVFYFSEDSRVWGHIDRWAGEENKEEGFDEY